MARSALDSWAGGSYTSYRTTPRGPLCVAIAAAFDGPADRFAEAVTWWTAAMGRPATPLVNGQLVTFSICARGVGGTLPPEPAVSTTSAILVETSSVPSAAADTPAKVQTLLCAVRTVIDDPALAPVISAGPAVVAKDANVLKRFLNAAATCGA
jgi:hypothetical protein